MIFAFSGQGSQYYQMARELYESDAFFRGVMGEGSALIEEATGYDLLPVLYGERRRQQPWTDIAYTHLALLLVQWSCAMLVISWGAVPRAILGYSLGEVVAAVVARALTLGDAARLMAAQAESLIRRCERGSMLVALGPRERLSGRTPSGAFIACRNAPGHVVFAMRERDLARVQREVLDANLAPHVLPVEYAFHSPLIDPIVGDFSAAVQAVRVAPPTVPCFSCVHGAVRPSFDGEALWQIVRKEIDLPSTVAALKRQHGPLTCLDLSPSGVMLNLLRANRALDDGSRCEALLQPLRSEPSTAALRRLIADSAAGSPRRGVFA